MIFPAYLVLATFVFNAASVLGAPVKIAPASELAARAVVEPVEARSTVPEVEEIVRRFPRRAAYDMVMKRSEPEARAVPEPASRRFARRALYERVQQRSEPASEPEVRESAPELEVRRFPRAVIAEEFEKRQTTSTQTIAVTTPSGTPATPADINAVIDKIISTNNASGYQEGTTIKETTLLVNKVTHISPAKDNKNAGASPAPAPVVPEVPVVPSGTVATPTVPTGAVETPAVPSGSAAVETPAVVETPVATPTGEPVVNASPAPSSATEEQPAASAVPSEVPATNTETATGEVTTTETTTGETAQRREVDEPIIRRNSGPAWASYSKRTAN